MNNGVFDGSSKLYADPSTKSHHNDDVEMGHGGPGPYSLEMFAKDVDSVKEDVKELEKLYVRIQESNEDVKVSQNTMGTRELRDDMNADLDRRQLIESRSFAIIREKATTEAIDNLSSNEVVAESPLHQAIQDHGRGPVLDVGAEIEELRGSMMEIRRSLMDLHQVLLGISSPVVEPLAGERLIKGGPSTGEPGVLNNRKKITCSQICKDFAFVLVLVSCINLGITIMVVVVNCYLDYRFNGKG